MSTRAWAGTVQDRSRNKRKNKNRRRHTKRDRSQGFSPSVGGSEYPSVSSYVAFLVQKSSPAIEFQYGNKSFMARQTAGKGRGQK
jgi:hypothetical protein